MLSSILKNGAVAGLIVGVPMVLVAAVFGDKAPTGNAGLLVGYTTMLVALSIIFLAVKRQRDVANGGVIKFLPAFLMGLGISAVAGVFYVVAWEVTLAVTGMDFGAFYTEHLIEAAKARGASEAEIAAETAKAQEFVEMYENPLFRMPITFTEILPVGLLVSLVSALLLRNSRFMPAKA
ncbi:MAG: DUF4199 domain-containing protein [Acidobacteria bacterium]|jgi:hypothetical protein|nr:DUF4199 domain-containing protein [Acidobacteriota bacterium]